MQERSLLEIKNLTKVFEQKGMTKTALKKVSLKLYQGETLGIVGESGCGKTTLARIVMRLLPPSSGELLYEGKNIFAFHKKEAKVYGKAVQMIFQNPYSSIDPSVRILSSVEEGMKIHKMYNKLQIEKEAKRLLQRVGIAAEAYDKYPGEFSGGQLQRICIARALALKPSLIICDEPTSALDVSIKSQIINLLMELQEEEKVSYLFIGHELELVRYVSHRIAVLYQGEIVECNNAEELCVNPSHSYTKKLFNREERA